MNHFRCTSCEKGRVFDTFYKFFYHTTTYHQNDLPFRITCDLHESCGLSFRNFFAYKTHLYRFHKAELSLYRLKSINKSSATNHADQLGVDDVLEAKRIDEPLEEYYSEQDDEDIDSTNDGNFYCNGMNEFLGLDHDQQDDEMTMENIIRSFILFMTQLREEFLVPKPVMKVVTNYIVTLIEMLQSILMKSAGNDYSGNSSLSSSASAKPADKVIKLEVVQSLVRDICQRLSDVTKNEYRFEQISKSMFNYDLPIEIIIGRKGINEKFDTAYLIPIEKSLIRVLGDDEILSRVLQTINQERKSTNMDHDLLLSFRHGNFGSRIDDDSLLLQLFIDDIGVTNPIGAKKDNHKLTMLYYTIEDLPQECKSKSYFVQLLGICKSKCLKVRHCMRILFQNPVFFLRVSIPVSIRYWNKTGSAF